MRYLASGNSENIRKAPSYNRLCSSRATKEDPPTTRRRLKSKEAAALPLVEVDPAPVDVDVDVPLSLPLPLSDDV